MLKGADGQVFVADADRAAVLAGHKQAEPLVLHVNVGDCIQVQLSNDTSHGAVSYHCDLLSADPATSAGVAAGREPPQTVAVGSHRTYTYYASPEVGETVSLVRDWGNVLTNPGLGLYGAIVVGPRGATYQGSGWAVDVHPPGAPAYRDATVFLQDADEVIGTHRMPYTTTVGAPVGINYQAAPLSSSDHDVAAYIKAHGDPPTPLLHAYAGDPVRVHVLAPWSEQAHVFSIEGHQWPLEPGRDGTNLLSSVRVGGLEALTLQLQGGAGGPAQLPGTYVYGDHRGPYFEAGMWGLFKVYPRDADVGALPHLTGGGSLLSRPRLVVGAFALVGALALVALRRVARRRPA
jgi:hypothetical protein